MITIRVHSNPASPSPSTPEERRTKGRKKIIIRPIRRPKIVIRPRSLAVL